MQILKMVAELHEVEQQRLHVAKHFLPMLTRKVFVTDEQGKSFQPFPIPKPIPLNAFCGVNDSL